jgi:ADP-ribose pyrophosphatase YjhB (NUDIX family)
MVEVRCSGRALIFDETGRLLLLFGPVPGDSTRLCWYPPGGRLEADESFEAATQRELAEELGVCGIQLGPLVWTREVRRLVQGREQLFISQFFLVRTASFVPDMHAIGASEAGVQWRWWTLEDLDGESPSSTIPSRLGDLVRPLLHGDVPNPPVDVSNHE